MKEATVTYVLSSVGALGLGLIIGGVLGYVLRGVVESRREARATAREVHQIHQEMRETGAVEVRSVVILMLAAVLVSIGGVVTSVLATQQTACLRDYNEEFRQAYLARVAATEEATAAADKDRMALDAAIVSILAATTREESRAALETYLEARKGADAQRAAAQEVRDANPYPLPPECP